ncbi:MAG TPA: amidohydrolase family protein [Chitinophagaceae bacterium]|jgi:cytosine/adenosine deaminase-related metal-dependent hydrolase|nr:amidohydrolase family protein [Chitinophagaceae bacterium]
MAYRKFKADQLFDGHHLHGNDKVLITDDSGKVEGVVPFSEAGDNIETFSGILTPGLINCHCHLELSHLKNVIPPHTGLIEFLCSVVTKRDFPREAIDKEIIKAEKEMYNNGIVAVGDIGNTADTAEVKSKSKIRWQNFVEVLGFTDEKADENINYYKQVANTLEQKLQTSNLKHRTSLVPHAPYSISPKTFKLINELTKNQVISIHNQEHPAEDVLYKTGGGEYLRLFKIFGINESPFPVTGLSSIRSALPYFNNGQTIFLIHNTFMPEEDVVFAQEYADANGIKLIWCLCVNANLYIENKVPPIEMLMKHNCPLVLGTDSYSSNWQLSIAKEIQAIRNNFPSLSVETILQWATRNGAKALQWNRELGSFEKGKTPGIILLDLNFDQSIRII